MEKPELLTENWGNIHYPKTEYSNLVSRFQDKNASLEVENKKTDKLEKLEIRNKKGYVGIFILAIIFAEILIYLGRLREALWIHTFTLIGLSLSIKFMKNEDVYKTYQALMLLPLLRLVNFSMPSFFDMTLYYLAFIYTPLVFPVTIAVVYQQFTRESVGITLRRIWLYIPLSIPISLGMAAIEYRIIQPGYLTPDLSLLSLLKLTVVMVFFVGLIEEVIFRSIIQTRLIKIFGVWGGILLQSMLFGFMHSSYGILYEILYTSFVGVIIGYIFYKTRSLPFAVFVHGFINVFLFGVIPHLSPGLGLL